MAEESTSPASYVQRSMWAYALRFRGAPLYEMTIPWRIEGPLRVELLEAALADLVARHPTLRARLELRKGQLFQVVGPPERVVVEHANVDGAGAQVRLKTALAALHVDDRKEIDIVGGPTIRARLLKLAADDHVLCLFVHHSMCDGWSLQVMMRDLAAFYLARLRGEVADLSALEEQYTDLAAWEAATYASGGFAEEIRYWRSELADLPPPIALPTRVPSKGNRDWSAATPVHHEPAQLLGALKGLAQQSRVSVYAALVSALAVLLHQRMGAQDMLIGVSTLNRWSAKSMEWVGCATSLLPARVRIPEGVTFDALCRQVNGTIRRMLANGRIPLELIQRETTGSLLGGPVFPVWCQYQEVSAPMVAAQAGLSFSSLAADRRCLVADLDVDMVGSADGLRCEFAHRRALFSPTMIEALTRDYGQILHAVVAEWATPVKALVRLMNGAGFAQPG